MKKYTQADFDNFEVDEYGRKICPAGNYTAIKSFDNGCRFGAGCSFGEGCRFGAGCSFGEGCRFGAWCSFGEGCRYENGAVQNGRYVAVDRIGSENRKAYFYIDDNGNMFVRAGCWFSDMAAFKERVKKVHAGTIHEKTYLAACDLAELMLKGSNEDFLQSGKKENGMGEVKNYPPYLDYPKPYKAKTNADRIRAMSDEELANFLTGFSNNGLWATEIEREVCYKTIADYLQQPVEEIDDDE